MKGEPVLSTEEVEKATDKTVIKKGKGKRNIKLLVSSKAETDSSTDNCSDVKEALALEIFDSIEVAKPKS